MGLNLPQNSGSADQRVILDALPSLVFLERAGNIVFANAEARRMLGAAEGEWTPCPVEDVLWGLFTGASEPRTALTGTLSGRPFHATLSVGDGRLIPVEGTYSTVSAELREAVIVAHPIGGRRAPKSQVMDDVLASIPDAVVISHNGHVLYTNPAFTRMFGFSAEDTGEGNLWDRILPENRRHERTTLEKAVDQHGRARIETVRLSQSGDLVEVAVLAGPLLVDGVKVGYVFSYREIGERKRKEARLVYDALHDGLTGLPNRALFLDRMTQALARRLRRMDQGCGVLFVDLDRFKEINDTLGHAAGDALLVAVSERLRASLRPQDTAARLGGDEFAVLVENIHSITGLEIVAGRVSREMERPFEILGETVQSGASIGAAMAAADHTAPELLIRDADFAMYSAKQEGGGRFEIFDKNLAVHFSSQQERERELRHVLENRQFEFWYQPIYRLQSGRLEGFESLLRWRRADGSVESFRELLPVADDTGLAISLGRETLETVCRQMQSWKEQVPGENLTLTINLTDRQFYHPDMVGLMRTVLDSTGVDPTRLLFEVSETTLSENPDVAAAILQRMVDCHVRIAVDNFGSSLAPLNLLLRLPIDMLKLDPRLTAAATTKGRQLVVLKSLARLGHSLGIQVVAQGIETPLQLHALCRMGCELGQGRLLAHPMDPDRALHLARQGCWVTAHDS